MGDPSSEKMIFDAFLRTEPNFADEDIASWEQPKPDPPDVLCVTGGGRRIGVELAAWLHESQMGREKRNESLEDSILSAIGSQPNNKTSNIYFAQLYPKPVRGVAATDKIDFRSENFSLISEVDTKWESRPFNKSPQGYWHEDFSGYPTLEKYLAKVVFHPRDWYEGYPPSGTWTKRTWPPDNEWLIFKARGGAYSEQDMVDALRTVLRKKIEKYKGKPPVSALDEFHLLVHYDQAYRYNTPIETVCFKFEDVAKAASTFIRSDPGLFNKVFLFFALNPGERVFQLFPLS